MTMRLRQTSGVDLVRLRPHSWRSAVPADDSLRILWRLGGDDKVYGYEKRENTNFIVTSGISDWAIKFKTGCRSEYVLIDIQGEA